MSNGRTGRVLEKLADGFTLYEYRNGVGTKLFELKTLHDVHYVSYHATQALAHKEWQRMTKRAKRLRNSLRHLRAGAQI